MHTSDLHKCLETRKIGKIDSWSQIQGPSTSTQEYAYRLELLEYTALIDIKFVLYRDRVV